MAWGKSKAWLGRFFLCVMNIMQSKLEKGESKLESNVLVNEEKKDSHEIIRLFQDMYEKGETTKHSK